MKKLKVFAVSFLLAVLTIQAAPVEAYPIFTHRFDPPTLYENNQPIVGDTLSYVYWCGSDQGGLYEIPIIATPPDHRHAARPGPTHDRRYGAVPRWYRRDVLL